MSADGHSGAVPLPVAIQRYFEVALYLLLLTGFGTLASTGSLDLGTVLLVGAALFFRGYLLTARRTLLIPERWTTFLTLIYVAFYLADYFLISGAFVTTTVHLVLFVMVVRLFSARRDRDYYFLSVIAFLMVLAAAVLTVDSVFLLAFAAFMLMAVVTFILMEMRRASTQATVQAKASTDALAYRHMAFSIARTAPALVVFILIGAAAIFFLLPRVSTGYLSAYAPGGEITSGFSDSVQLGRIGQIQQSSAVVMHIAISGDQRGAFDLKWRGVALSHFDGKTWSNLHTKFAVPRSVDGSFALRDPEPGPVQFERVRPIRYRVLMEPIGANVFFLAATPRVLEGNYRVVAMDRGGAVFDLDPYHPVGQYQASSIIPLPTATELRQGGPDIPLQILWNNLQLPHLDPRIGQLAQKITASATNNYDRAAAIENYLRTRYGYTLELPRTVPADPVAHFLFVRHEGHCEYFASAMAVMLRSLGIPARVVNGFRTGEFNDLTSEYVVRASNAHAWVETFFPGYGWVSFDPTPAGLPPPQTRWSRAMLYFDAMASFWREWIVNYDVGHQVALGRSASLKSREFIDRVREWERRNYEALLARARQAQATISESPTRWTIGALLATGLILLAANVRRIVRAIQRQRIAAHPDRAPQLGAAIWYSRMVRLAARRGWRKSPGQTPQEFLESIQDLAVREQLARFTRHYEHARFGDSAEDASCLPELYEEISKNR